MKNLVVFGANGSLAKYVVTRLKLEPDIRLTPFVRSKNKLKNIDLTGCNIIEGDVLNYDNVNAAIKGQDIVYGNLAGDLGKMAQNIIKAMNENNVRKLIFICSIGIYNEPVPSVLKPYRAAADVIESSNVDYTILRPTWFTNDNDIDYEITEKSKPEKGSIISRKSIAEFINEIIKSPEKYKRQSLGINKPNS